jgi:hypothetical protein
MLIIYISHWNLFKHRPSFQISPPPLNGTGTPSSGANPPIRINRPRKLVNEVYSASHLSSASNAPNRFVRLNTVIPDFHLTSLKKFGTPILLHFLD